MNRTVRSLVVLSTVLTAGVLLGQDQFEGRDVVSRRVLVKFKPGLESRLGEAAASLDVLLTRIVGRNGVVLMQSQSRNVNQMISVLKLANFIEYVEPDYILKSTATPNDTSFGLLWGMQNTGQSIQGVPGTAGVDIRATGAWDISTGSSSIVVGVVDTGVDYNHADLQGNIWTAPSSFTVNVGSGPLTCPAGSHGYNAILHTCDPLDDNDHGTHVSGTIGARGNNAAGVVGVNWNTSIMGLKFLDSTGNGSTSDAVDAIEFAIQAKAQFGSAANVRVLSNSWSGSGFSQTLLDEINKAAGVDMLFVAAAGNNGSSNDLNARYPANYNAPNIISVAAIDNLAQLASFSNFGSNVHLGAPGVSVLSTVRNGGYAYFNGTSMATPHVSGAAALVLSVCNLTTAALKQNLLANVVPTLALNGRTSTGGRLNVDQAIRNCSGIGLPDFTLSATPSSQAITPGSTTTFTVNVVPVNGFSSPVTLSVTGMPSGALGVFGTNPTNGASTLTVYTGSSIALGSYPLTITGVSGTTTRTTLATLVISNTPADFSLVTTPSSQSVTAGNGASYSVAITRTAGFAGAVTFSISGLPSGASGSFSPNPSSGASSALNITTTAATAPGSYPLTFTGTSGSLTHTSTATLVIASGPDFSLAATPASQSVTPGNGTTYTVNITRTSGFAGSVTFSISGLPLGAGGSFSPNPASGASSTLSITTTGATPTGSYPLTITGTSGSLTHTASATLVVNPPPDFSLAATPASQSVSPGNGTSYTVNITAVGGFSGPVTFSLSGLPSGAGGSFSPNPSSGASSTLSITTTGVTPTGSYPLTITGTSGALTHTTSATLIVSSVPDFSIVPTPPTQTILPGSTATYAVGVNAVGGFAGAVTFSASGLPAGSLGIFNPNPATGASTLTVYTGGSIALGTYPFTLTGTSGSLTHTASATLVISNTTADFSLGVTPSSQSVTAGNGTTYTVNITRSGGFAGGVTFSLSGLPSGAGGSFSPNPSSGASATLTLTTTGATPAGSYPLTITGVSGSLTHTASATLVVTSGPDFSLSSTPSSQSVTPGNGTSYTVNINRTLSFAGAITLSVSGLPSGAGGTFSPNPGTGASSTLTITTTGATPTGSYPLTITGISGSLTHTASATLVVNPPPDFSLSATPASQSVTPGNGTTYTINITPVGGFSGPVTFSLSGLPGGAGGMFSPNPSSGATSTLTIMTTGSVPTGSYPLTITGTSGALSHTASATLVISTVPDFTLSTTPPSRTIATGGSATYTVNITPVSGFSGSVSFSVSGLPSGTLGLFSPNPSGGGSSTLTVYSNFGVPAATYPLTITGTSGSLTHTTPATLIVN